MYQLFQQYFRIAVFRATPQDLPGQSVVLWISIAAALVTGMAGLLFAYDPGDALARSILALAIPAVLVYLLLKIRNLQHRFNQTFSAMCGSAAIIYVLVFPLMPYFFNADAETESGKWLIMLVLMIDVWALMITAYIFKHAMGVGLATGVSYSIILMVITLFVFDFVEPRQTHTASPMDFSASHQPIHLD